MRCLVTGGAGFIGSNLCRRLLKDGHNVDMVDDLSSGYEPLVRDLGFLRVDRSDCHYSPEEGYKKFFLGDFANDYLVLSRIKNKKYDVVFHVAAIPRVPYSVDHPYESNETNVGKTVKLLESCVDNVSRFIFSSSSSVYGTAELMPTPSSCKKDPRSPYALQKSVIEDYCSLFSKLYGLDTVCLRYFNVFGPGQFAGSSYSTALSAWCQAIKNGTTLRSDGDGGQTRDLCYVDNVVHANVITSQSSKDFNGDCYNVCCGKSFTNREILQFMKERFKNIDVHDAPWRAGDIMHTLGDFSKFTKEVGYEPIVEFWDGVERTLDWWNL